MHLYIYISMYLCIYISISISRSISISVPMSISISIYTLSFCHTKRVNPTLHGRIISKWWVFDFRLFFQSVAVWDWGFQGAFYKLQKIMPVGSASSTSLVNRLVVESFHWPFRVGSCNQKWTESFLKVSVSLVQAKTNLSLASSHQKEAHILKFTWIPPYFRDHCEISNLTSTSPGSPPPGGCYSAGQHRLRSHKCGSRTPQEAPGDIPRDVRSVNSQGTWCLLDT